MVSDPYLWFKSVHIISVIAWMAGLLYLPRIFVYHAGSVIGGEASEKFKVMERRLLKFIMTPSMILSWLFGLLTALSLTDFFEIWFFLKLFFVLLLTVYHFLLSNFQKKFEKDENTRSIRFFKIFNEVPTVVMIVVVFLVVLKPF